MWWIIGAGTILMDHGIIFQILKKEVLPWHFVVIMHKDKLYYAIKTTQIVIINLKNKIHNY